MIIKMTITSISLIFTTYVIRLSYVILITERHAY